MKNINDLMQLIGEMFEIKDRSHKFFIQTYGHVKKIEIRYYKNGWSAEINDKPIEKSAYFDEPEQVELLYWWFKILLKSNDYE
jgi:hypothetical protein